MTETCFYRLRDDVELQRRDPWRVLVTPQNYLPLKADDAGAHALLEALRTDWETEEELASRFSRGAEEVDWARFYFLFQKLLTQRFLQVQARWEDEPLFSVIPAPAQPLGQGVSLDPGRTYRLSRFAYLHRDGRRLLLESPLTLHQCHLHRPGLVEALSRLAEGFQPDRDEPIGGLPGEVTETFLRVLASLSLIEDDQSAEESRSPGLPFWEFHDLLFHIRSEEGRHVYPLGGTYRFQGQRDPLLPLKPPMGTDVIPLPSPDESAREKLRRPFGDVLEARQSLRQYAESPLRVADLGAFLFAAARVKKVAPAVSRLTAVTDLGEVSFRPSPSGGASHPLEIYPLVRECDGLAPGLYHYQPDRHALARVEPVGPGLEKLMKWGRFDLMGFDEPPLLLLITARFGRTAWKYQSIAYRLIHTDLGCLYQTFYLVATALDLAPCALGAVNPDLFASVTGVDVYAEPLVGAFTLGRER